MIKLIIWSKDRAAQLDLLLRSIRKNIGGIFNISVIYKFSNKQFFDSYMKLVEDYPEVDWIRELKSIQGHTKFAVNEHNEELVSFATDDCVFFREVNKFQLLKALPEQNNQVFSLRLGYNTIMQNVHTGQTQPPLNIKVEHENHLSWPLAFYHPHDNYGYPFGLDLHVFRKTLIKPILDEIEFRSTNELESQLTTKYRHRVDEMRSFKHSVAVNIPINTVTGVTRAGEFHAVSKEELNQRFLDGWKIDLAEIAKHKIIGCHQEIPFSWVK